MSAKFFIIFKNGSHDTREGDYLSDTLNGEEQPIAASVRDERGVVFPMTKQGVNRAIKNCALREAGLPYTTPAQ